MRSIFDALMCLDLMPRPSELCNIYNITHEELFNRIDKLEERLLREGDSQHAYKAQSS